MSSKKVNAPRKYSVLHLDRWHNFRERQRRRAFKRWHGQGSHAVVAAINGRNKLIFQLRRSGRSYREIAADVGLSPAGVHKIVHAQRVPAMRRVPNRRSEPKRAALARIGNAAARIIINGRKRSLPSLPALRACTEGGAFRATDDSALPFGRAGRAYPARLERPPGGKGMLYEKGGAPGILLRLYHQMLRERGKKGG